MHIWKIREKEVKNNCRLSEKAEEDRKEAKAAAALFNAQIVEPWCRVTKQREIPVVYHLLSLS